MECTFEHIALIIISVRWLTVEVDSLSLFHPSLVFPITRMKRQLDSSTMGLVKVVKSFEVMIQASPA